MRNKKLLF